MLRLKILLYKYNFKNRFKFNFLLLLCFATLIFLLVFYLFIYDDFSYENYVCSKFKSINQDLNDNQSFKDEDDNDKEKFGKNVNNNPDVIYIKACNNKVRKQHRLAVWTMLSDNQLKYTIGAIKLLKSLKANISPSSTIQFDSLIIELAHKPIQRAQKRLLRQFGWRICVMDRIEPRDESRTYIRFRDQFTKLNLWRIDEYIAHYYFDADVLAVRNLNEFFHLHEKLNDDDKRIGCTQDFRDYDWVNTFNMGVFVLRPNDKEFKRLIALKNDVSFKFDEKMSEQGFLNEVYKNKWFNIGFGYNANLAVYGRASKYWHENERNISIIHYTIYKPWECSSAYGAICDMWNKFDHCD